ncbi:MAG: nuclear transport factor 2 family protein [Bacteroidota bacterium]
MISYLTNSLSEFYDAFKVKNWTLFASFLSKDFTYYTDKGVVQTKTDFVQFLSKNEWTTSNYSITNLRVISTNLDDFTVLTYNIEFNGFYQGKPIQVKAIETTVFIKSNDNWYIHHSHSSNY